MDGADSTAVNNNALQALYVFSVFVSGACTCPVCYDHTMLQTATTVNSDILSKQQ